MDRLVNIPNCHIIFIRRTRKKVLPFPFNFLRLPPAPPAVFERIRNFLVLRARLEEARPRRGKVGITTRSARKIKFEATTRVARASYQSLRDCCSKKVRAKVTISPPILLLPETAKCGASRSDTQCQERATRRGRKTL